MHKNIRARLVNYPTTIIKFSKRFPILSRAIASFIITLILLLFINKYPSETSSEKLIIGQVGSVLYINPVIQTANPNEILINSLVYDPLLEPNIDGTILPELAKTWTITDGGKRYLFVLRNNIFWQDDNSLLSADDVYTTLNVVKNSKQNTALVKALKNVSINKLGPLTLEFRLKQPNNNFLELLNIYIAKATNLKNYSYAQLLEEPELYTPIGTGPYIIAERTLNKIVLKRNNRYFKQAPKIKNIAIKFFDSRTELANAYINNSINFFTTRNPQDVQKVQFQPHTRIYTFTLAYYTRVLYFNLLDSKSPTSDINLRNAIFYTLDKPKLITNYPGAQVSTGPYNELSWAYLRPKEKTPNLVKAKTYLKLCKQKFKNKCTQLTITFAKTPENFIIVERIKKQLEQIGIQLKLRPLTSLEILQQILPNRDFELLYFGISSTIDPDQYNLWHSSQINYPGLNISGLKSKRIDYYLEQGRIVPDRIKRQYYYQQFQQELSKYRPVIYLFNPPIYIIAPDRLEIPINSKYVISEQQIFQNVQKWYFNILANK